MADTLIRAKGTLATSSATLYTVPANTKTIIKSLILANKTSVDKKATVVFAGINIVPNHVIRANDALRIPLTEVLLASDTITGLAEAADTIDYYISGIEVV